jgi:hypothetical protein
MYKEIMTVEDISSYVKKQKSKPTEYKMISSQDNDEEMNIIKQSKDEKNEIILISQEINTEDDDIQFPTADHDEDLLDNDKIEDLKKEVLGNDI